MQWMNSLRAICCGRYNRSAVGFSPKPSVLSKLVVVLLVYTLTLLCGQPTVADSASQHTQDVRVYKIRVDYTATIRYTDERGEVQEKSVQRLSSNCRASGILSAMETVTRKPYETDLTDDEWAILEPVLKRALYGDKTKTRGHPRHYPLREIVNAILYVLKTGCQWRNLPHDLPPWKTVYYHFRRWEKRGVLAQIRDTLVEQARAQAGKAAPKHLAVDSQSVPSTAKGGTRV